MATPNEQQVPQGPVGRFLRTHSRTLQAIGLLTLAATFIVRDVLRERTKEFEDDLKAAQRTFDVRSDIALIRDQLEDLRQESHQRGESTGLSEATLRHSLSTLGNSTYATKRSAEALCDLAKSASSQTDRATACKQVENSTNLAAEIYKARDDLGGFFGAGKAKERRDLYYRLLNGYLGIARYIDFGGETIIEHGIREREQNERRYDFLNTLYYWLFIVGLVIGAIGIYYGIEGLSVTG